MTRPRVHSIELPLGRVVLCADAEVERLNPVKTRTVITEVVVLFDGMDVYEQSERLGWQLPRSTIDGFVSTVEAMLREKVMEEAVRLDEGR